MKIVAALLLLLLVPAINTPASIALRKSMEIVLSEDIDRAGRYYLIDIDDDGYLDILFDLDSKIGWYSGAEEIIKSSIEKKFDYSVSRAYSLGFFDNDTEPDYVETVIADYAGLKLLVVYYLSTDGFSGADTVALAEVTGNIQPDPFQFTYYHVVRPSIHDLNEDGIDEIYTGYYYYDGICYTGFCSLSSTESAYFSHQFGEANIGTSAVSSSSYETFNLDGHTQPLKLLFSNPRRFGEGSGLGQWDESPLEVTTVDGARVIGRTLLKSNALCLSPEYDPYYYYYSIKLVSSQLLDPRDGHSEPRLLARTRLRTSSVNYYTAETCLKSRDELVDLDLSGYGKLNVNWRAVAPDWATSDIIFADTRKPDHLFLSNKVRLYQVESATLQMIDYSNEADLAGRMVGYQPLSDGEEPTLLVLDGDRLKFFKFDFLIPTDVDDRPDGLPTDFTLAQNYPNPFNPSTEIAYSLPTGSHVKLTVYNSLGQEVKVLVDKFVSAGAHTAGWDAIDKSGNPVASGVYLYRLRVGDLTESKKMLLLK